MDITIKEIHSKREPFSLVVKAGDEVLGYLVVDSLIRGRSHGGIRMGLGIAETEIRMLAHTMTRKYRFLNLPFGGAKAGVIGDPEADQEDRLQRLTAFGKAIRSILEEEIFVPAGDMGTDITEIRTMLNNINVRFERRRLPDISSGEFTAHSIFAGLHSLTQWQGQELPGMSAAIQGFGEVGSNLARLLAEAGVEIHAVSTSKGAIYSGRGLDIEQILELSGKYGNRLVEHYKAAQQIRCEDLISLPVEILSPCATIHAIHPENVAAVCAKYICPGANNPWSGGIEKYFDEKGIQYLPDFAANTGGIVGTILAYVGVPHSRIIEFIHTEFNHINRYLLESADEMQISIQGSAATLLESRNRESAHGDPGFKESLISFGVAMHRRGWVPIQLVAPIAMRYLRGRIRAGLS